MQKLILAMAIAAVVAGCSSLSPEQRAERNFAKAMAMAPATLCYAILFRSETPPQAQQAADQRGINCTSPEMVELAKAKQLEVLADQAAKRDASRNLQNLGASIMQQGQANQPRPLTTCTMVGNTMSCY